MIYEWLKVGRDDDYDCDDAEDNDDDDDDYDDDNDDYDDGDYYIEDLLSKPASWPSLNTVRACWDKLKQKLPEKICIG